MTEEKMRKGEELFKELSYLKNQKQKWENLMSCKTEYLTKLIRRKHEK